MRDDVRAAFIRAHTRVQCPPLAPTIRLHLADEATERVVGALAWFRYDGRDEPFSVTASHCRRHLRLRREMMMDACALDADLGREIAKAEPCIPAFTDVGLGEIHQTFGGSTHESLRSIDR